jgi:hypothetical protein
MILVCGSVRAKRRLSNESKKLVLIWETSVSFLTRNGCLSFFLLLIVFDRSPVR